MKFLTTIILLTLFQNNVFAQVDSTNYDISKDTIHLDMKSPMISAIELFKALTDMKGLYKYLVKDYKSLLEINGNYFNTGYISQGLGTYEMGISHGKRELLSITKFKEIHLNVQYAVSPIDKNQQYYGLNLGISKSGLFFNKALEGQFITDFKSNKVFIFRPEIGLTFLGSYNFNYGINLVITKIDRLNTHVFHFRYTKQNFDEKIKEKIIQIKATLERDKSRLKSMNIDIPVIEVKE